MITKHLNRKKRFHPNLILIGSFAFAILLGGVLLSAPFSVNGTPISFLDALFTATSAVCVTGLTVVDTGSRFSPAGQGVILVLIQLGGLGIMTYSTVVLLILGKRLSFKGREVVQGTLSIQGGQRLFPLIRNVFIVTVLFEGVGFLLLYLRWRVYFPGREALAQALFHSISAFCNAGFSLFSSSLIGFRNDPWINLIVVILIVSGGIGFLVLQEIPKYFITRFVHGKRIQLSLHSRTVLITTVSLILAGMVGFLLLEWNNTLAGASIGEKVLTALFQSVTPRTAGFSTVDYHLLTNATLLFMLVLMFIGASPGSTGGGIKTTSFAVLLALAYAKWKARVKTFLFRRTIPDATVARTTSIILGALFLILFATMILMITEVGFLPHPESRGLFLEYLFEAFSAFGTVGLSTGVTSSLSPAGKLIIMMLMFVGRLGPITIALAIGGEKREEGFTYPEENIMVG